MAKEKYIPVRVEEEVKEAFEKACADNFTTPSAELYKFVRQYIKRNQSKPISLNQIRRKS